jgi:selenocysteine-specific elongation factor
MSYIVIGTSGHVDHGKTSLIKTITGIDPDRLKEEKLRGMTTDIGFSYFKIDNNLTLSIVDVPGHEKFLKNMLAGVTAIKTVMFVISANEGIKPQTIEHFEILKMLNIKYGVIVLTKTDLVSLDELDLLEIEIKDFVKNSFLENSKIIRFSNITQEGKENLITSLKELSYEIIKENDYKNSNSVIFPIDRVFSKQGFGTIVTGSLYCGEINIDQQLVLIPSNQKVKVKNIEIHNNKFNSLKESERAGLTISSVETKEIERGYCLISKEIYQETQDIFVKIKLLKGIKLKNNQRLRLNFLTNDVIGRIILFDKENNNDSFYAKIKLEEKVFIPFNTTIVIRNYSPLHLIGSANVLSIHNLKVKNKNALLNNFDNKNYFEAIKSLINDYNSTFDLDEILKYIPYENRDITKKELIEKNIIVEINKKYYLYNLLTEKTKEVLDIFKTTDNKKVGFTKVDLQHNLNIELSIVEKILSILNNDIEVFDNMYYLKSKKKSYIDTNPLCKNLYEIILENKFQNIKDLNEKTKLNSIQLENLLKMLIHDNKILKISSEIYVSLDIWKQTINIVRDFIELENGATTSILREKIGTSRKYMIPILETLDNLKITKRDGDIRVLY